MAYRFRLNEPIQRGFRRIGVDQIERAQAELSALAEPDKAIHGARKSIKRIRALLRLMRPGLGETIFRAENAQFREIAALLAPARDRHVLIETMLKLDASAQGVASAGLAALRKLVQDDTNQASPAGAASVAEAVERLSAAAARFRRLKLSHDGFETISRGLEASYRKGRRGLEHAYRTGIDEDFHDWRKAVQQHWRHMSLLSRAWPDAFEARVTLARELSQILGDDHDLSILSAYAMSQAPEGLTETHAREIVRLATLRQTELRTEARLKGQILFAERARAHSRHIATVWQSASLLRSMGQSRQSGPRLNKQQAG